MIEPVLLPITYIYNLDDLGCQPLIEQVRLGKFHLEIGRTRKNQATHVALIVSNEVVGRKLGHLAEIVMALFLSQAGKSEGGLTTTTVLFWQLDLYLL